MSVPILLCLPQQASREGKNQTTESDCLIADLPFIGSVTLNKLNLPVSK